MNLENIIHWDDDSQAAYTYGEFVNWIGMIIVGRILPFGCNEIGRIGSDPLSARHTNIVQFQIKPSFERFNSYFRIFVGSKCFIK